MDNNISFQIKRLIDVDKRAVELEGNREDELRQLIQDHTAKKAEIESQLKAAKDEAKRAYEKLVAQAQMEAEAITKDAAHKMQEIENTLQVEIDVIAAEWWDRILKSI